MPLTPEQQERLDRSIYLARLAKEKRDAENPLVSSAPPMAPVAPVDNSYLGIFSSAAAPITSAIQQSIDPIGYAESNPPPVATPAVTTTPVASPVAPKSTPAPTRTQELAKEALAVRTKSNGSSSKATPDVDVKDLLKNPEKLETFFTSSAWKNMSADKQEKFNSKLRTMQHERGSAEQVNINNSVLQTGSKNIEAQEDIDNVFKLRAVGQQYWDNKNAEEAKKDSDEFEGAVKRAQQANEVVRNFTIDPERYGKNMSVGSKVLAGIALALGSFGGARTGQNSAVPVLQSFIDRDIAAQEKQLDAKKSAGHQDNLLLGQLEKVLGNREAARKAAKSAYMQQYTDKIDEMYRSATNQDERMKLATVAQQMHKEANDTHDQFVDGELGRAQQVNAARAQAAANAAAARRKEFQTAFKEAEELASKEDKDAPADTHDVRVAKRVAQKLGISIGEVAHYMPAFGAPGLYPSVDTNSNSNDGAEKISTQLGAKNIPALETALNDIRPEDFNYGPNFIQRSVASGDSEFNKSVVNSLSSEEGIAARQRLTQAQQLYLRMLTGAGVGEKEASMNAAAVFGDYSPEAIQRGLGKIRAEVSAQKENIMAGPGRAAAQQYQSNLPRQAVTLKPGG